MLFNVCHGSPGAALQGDIKPHEGTTSYIKLSGVQTDKAAPPINMIVKNTTEYFPAWPVLGNCLKDDCSKFERDEADGESLKPAGYLNNGRKSGWDGTSPATSIAAPGSPATNPACKESRTAL